jgi:hypothetical protein
MPLLNINLYKCDYPKKLPKTCKQYIMLMRNFNTMNNQELCHYTYIHCYIQSQRNKLALIGFQFCEKF